MGHNPFQHVDVRVTSFDVARPFYIKLLPALGFEVDEGGQMFHTFGARCPDGPTWFGFTEDPEHRPNANRLAFRARDRAEVDRLAAIAVEAGARNMSGPRACPEYTPTYYAAFFEDPDGNCLEVCYVE